MFESGVCGITWMHYIEKSDEDFSVNIDPFPVILSLVPLFVSVIFAAIFFKLIDDEQIFNHSVELTEYLQNRSNEANEYVVRSIISNITTDNV